MVRRSAVIIAALTVVLAFFLPWMNGSNELDSRTFSGFDFARLIRNFEITAETPSTVSQITATAIALYLVPALAVNAIVFDAIALANRGWSRAAALASIIGAVCTFVVLAGLLVLSFLPISDLAHVVGWPAYGLVLTTGGALVMGSIGVLELRRWSQSGINP